MGYADWRTDRRRGRGRLTATPAPARAVDVMRAPPPVPRPVCLAPTPSVPGRTVCERRGQGRRPVPAALPRPKGRRPRLPRPRAATAVEVVRRPSGSGCLDCRGHRERSLPSVIERLPAVALLVLEGQGRPLVVVPDLHLLLGGLLDERGPPPSGPFDSRSIDARVADTAGCSSNRSMTDRLPPPRKRPSLCPADAQ